MGTQTAWQVHHRQHATQIFLHAFPMQQQGGRGNLCRIGGDRRHLKHGLGEFEDGFDFHRNIARQRPHAHRTARPNPIFLAKDQRK